MILNAFTFGSDHKRFRGRKNASIGGRGSTDSSISASINLGLFLLLLFQRLVSSYTHSFWVKKKNKIMERNGVWFVGKMEINM